LGHYDNFESASAQLFPKSAQNPSITMEISPVLVNPPTPEREGERERDRDVFEKSV